MSDEVITKWEDIDKLDFSLNDSSQHWGEIPEGGKPLDKELCEKVIISAVRTEKPKIKFPVTEEESNRDVRHPDIFPVNEIVRHTIKLNRHVKIMHKLLRVIETKKTDIKKCPPEPQMIVKEQSPKVQEQGKLRKETYEFHLGQSPQMAYLDDGLVHKLLTKSVLIILAQVGFDKTKRSALHLLIDIVKHWLTKVTHVCHSLSQMDWNYGRIGYTDILDHSFRAMGLSGINCVDEYYKEDVIGRRDRELAKSTYLIEKYNRIASEIEAGNNQTETEASSSNVLTAEPIAGPSNTNGSLIISDIASLLENSSMKPGFQSLHLSAQSSQALGFDPIPSTSTGITGHQTIRISPAPKKLKRSN